ncbi:30S ribosomal protein S14 [Pseudonocardia sp. RS010]|uniref:30S ribosomal protein S14 n=1 Tax=Pseudonocardia sp. RS010 TaxID=3385979 RepID=UPI0039A2E730
MASTAKIAANERRKEVVARHAERRRELKAIIKRPSTPPEQREAASRELRRQPRDASATRVRNRDATDGRPRGYVGKFGVSRVKLRQLAHDGMLPGVTKSSW